MADDKGGNEEVGSWPNLDLSHDGITRRLNEVGAKDQCPSCAQRAWNVFGIDGEWLISIDIFRHSEDGEDDHSIGKHIPAVGLICANCGFIRLHGARLFAVSDKGEHDSEHGDE